MENYGKIFMVPMSLGAENFKYYLPEEVLEKIRSIRYFIAENAKTARHYFILLGMREFLPKITVYEMDKHNKDFDYSV